MPFQSFCLSPHRNTKTGGISGMAESMANIVAQVIKIHKKPIVLQDECV